MPLKGREAKKVIEAVFGEDSWIGFDRFMSFALLDPDHGFYSQTRPVFGDQGHFVTAPLLGTWLARLLTQKAIDLKRRLKQVRWACTFTVREYGPGNGKLAADILRGMAQSNAWPDSYELIEASAARQAEQAVMLSGTLNGSTMPRVYQWTQATGSLTGLVLANEFLDALPVRLFEWQPDHPEGPVLEWGLERVGETEALVFAGPHGGEKGAIQPLKWRACPAETILRDKVLARAQAAHDRGFDWRPGHRGEWCPGLIPWVRTVSKALEAGEVLIFDYGYEDYELDHSDRPFGTLAGHSGHRRIDDWQALIEQPGAIDLTAHVNFSELAQAFAEEGFGVSLQTQAAWMLDQGVLDQARDLLFEGVGHAAGSPPLNAQALAQLSQLQILLGDSAMGQSFMVLSAKRL